MAYFNLSSVFNADVISNTGDTTQDAIDLEQNVLMTQSYATAGGGIFGNGIPDDGFFVANAFHPDIQLAYRDSNNGFNAWYAENTGLNMTFNVAQQQYSEVHIAAFATEGSTAMRLVLNYTDGTSVTTSEVTVDDWFNNIIESPSNYYLIDGLDRAKTNGTVLNDNNPAIFGFKFSSDPTKTLQSISIEKTGATGRLVVLGATGVEATPPNQAPTNLSLSSTIVNENVLAGSLIGTLSTTDPDTNDTFTYTLVAGAGDTDNSAFTIVGDQLRITASPDYETKPSYTIRVRTTDQGGLSTEKTLAITVNDLPETLPPLELRVDLSDSGTNPTGNWNTIPGNGTFNTLKDFGSGAATGVNLTIENVYTEAGSNQWFAGTKDWIDGSAGSDNFFGYKTAPLVARFSGLTAGKQYKIEVISATNAGGVSSDVQVQGNFANRSSDGSGGTGDDWNGNIGLQRWLIWDAVTANASGEIVVSSAAGAGSDLSVLNAIRIVEVLPNTPPSITAGQNFSITENSAAGTVVGTIAAQDPEGNALQNWQITAGNTDVDQDGKAAFAINAATGQITVNDADELNFTSSPIFNLQTTVSDGTATSSAQTVKINLTQAPQPGNSAPTGIALSNSAVNENVATNTVIGNLSSIDPDANDTFTYTLISGTGDTDNAAFLIVGDQLQIKTSPDFETKPNLSIRVRTTDQGGLTFDKVLAIAVNNVNEAPTNLNLSNSQVAENVSANTIIGTFATIDPDTGNTFTYSLVTGTGDTDNAAFTITNNQLKINVSPDFETKASYSIRVQTTDQNGLTFVKPLTVTVQDVAESFDQFTATQTADGLQLTLSKLQDVFNNQLLQTNLPIVGKMTGTIPSFLTTLRDQIVPAIRGAGNMTADAMETLLKGTLAGAQVVRTSNTNETSFEVTINQQSQVTKVASDLAMPGLGLKVDNATGQGTLNSKLKLVFGSNKNHGFFVDTGSTQLTSNLDFSLGSKFSASGKMGLFKVKLADDASSPTRTNANFSTKLNDIDAPGAANDGNHLTTTELQANINNKVLTTDSLTSDPNLGLKITTDMGSAAIPGINTSLFGDIPLLTYSNGVMNGTPNTNFTFKNSELSLGSLANNVVLPTLRKFNESLSPLRPVVKVLTYSLKPFGLGYLFPDSDGDGKVTLLDVAGNKNRVTAAALNAADTLFTLSSRPTSNSNAGLALGSFQVNNFNPFGTNNSIRNAQVVPTTVASNIDRQLAQAGSDGALIAEFKKLSGLGLKFTLLDSSTTAVQMLMGQPVNLFTYDLPELSLNLSVQKEKQIDGTPFAISIGGSLGLSTDLAFGFDTYGLQQWADTNYAADQSSKVFDGFYISDRANADGTGEDVDELKVNLGLEIGGGVGITYKPAVSLLGGLYGEIKGGINFDLKDPNNDGKVRGSELSKNSLTFSGVSVDAATSMKVTGSLGRLEATLLDVPFNQAKILNYNAKTGVVTLLETPLNEDTNGQLNNSKEKIYSAIRDLVAKQVLNQTILSPIKAPLSLASGIVGLFDKKAASQITTVSNQITNVVYNTVSNVGKKLWGWLKNEPLTNATIFLDANSNGIRDQDEPFTLTFADGSYLLDFDLAKFDKNQDGKLDGTEGQLIGTGGYDVYTGLKQAITFVAPADSLLITPMTTLVSQLMQQGIGQFEAQQQINTALGLPADVDLGAFDPEKAIEANDSLGATLEAVQAQVNSILTQTTRLLNGASNLSDAQISQEVIKALVSQVQSGASLNLSNTADVQKVLQASITNLQALAPNGKLNELQAIVDKVALVMTEGNQRLEQVAARSSMTDLMEQFGLVRKITLGKIADDLEAVGAGKKSVKALLETSTGRSFDKLLASAVDALTTGTKEKDFLRGSRKKDVLHGQAGNDNIFGGSGNDHLFGDAGKDSLMGEDGKDNLEGGQGNDDLNGGIDGDRLLGGDGNDVLTGDQGRDRLMGGKGRDRFSLSLSGTDKDRILDFSAKDDLLVINGISGVNGFTSGKTIRAKFFHVGSKAGDLNDYFVYNKSTGVLSYDADGKGKDVQTPIAQLSPGLVIGASNLMTA